MSETNIQNNSALISLSRAAQITGYHQDYLGQLCRMGKMSAIKVGRNWFTYPEAVNKLSSSSLAQIITEDQVQKFSGNQITIEEIVNDVQDTAQTNELETDFDFASPQVTQNVTISQVEGLPISIRTIATPARNSNTVQNILTSLRIESLQREVSDLRNLLSRLMSEVANHTSILEGRANNSHADLLRHKYISNFDFNAPYSRINIMEQNPAEVESKFAELSQGWEKVDTENTENNPILVWISATAVMIAFAVATFVIISGQVFGTSTAQVSTIYHHPHQYLQQNTPVYSQELESALQPTVAGDTLPTEDIGPLR